MSESQKYSMGGKCVEVFFNNTPACNLLKRELSIYKQVKNPTPDILVRVNDSANRPTEIIRNPAIHSELTYGFSGELGDTLVSWQKIESQIHVNMFFDEHLKSWHQKIRSRQFCHYYENIGQVFHEVVLIPSLYFFSDELCLIHGSSVSSPSGELLLFAGAGGAGKTLVELELTLKHGYNFSSDDITFLSNSGKIHSNFSYPKIYRYNTEGNDQLVKKIFSTRGRMDRIAWFVRGNILKSNKTRRRVDPNIFFNGRIIHEGALSKIFFFLPSQNHVSQPTILQASKAAKINNDILKSEYEIFHKHLFWHRANCYLSNTEPILDIDKVFFDWQKIQEKVFSKINCYLIPVPILASKRKGFIISLIREIVSGNKY